MLESTQPGPTPTWPVFWPSWAPAAGRLRGSPVGIPCGGARGLRRATSVFLRSAASEGPSRFTAPETGRKQRGIIYLFRFWKSIIFISFKKS